MFGFFAIFCGDLLVIDLCDSELRSYFGDQRTCVDMSRLCGI